MGQVHEPEAIKHEGSLVLVPFTRRSPITERFYSSACFQYFAPSGFQALPVPIGFQAQMPVFEDLCPGGRSKAASPPRVAQEVVIVPALKLVYIEMRKAGSSTIRRLLDRLTPNHKRPNFFTCGGAEVPSSCGVGYHHRPVKGTFHDPSDNKTWTRCSSMCLDPTKLHQYFVFSFTRHPVERFYSAWQQWLSYGKTGESYRYPPSYRQLSLTPQIGPEIQPGPFPTLCP